MKTNLTFRSWLPCLLAFVALSAVERPFSTAFAQGALTPPGPPGQTYRTLGQIEPRTPVTNSGALTISSSGSYYLTGNITVNSGDGNIVETAPGGKQVAVKTLDDTGDPPGAGALFGLAVRPNARAVYFVDDASNQLNLLN